DVDATRSLRQPSTLLSALLQRKTVTIRIVGAGLHEDEDELHKGPNLHGEDKRDSDEDDSGGPSKDRAAELPLRPGRVVQIKVVYAQGPQEESQERRHSPGLRLSVLCVKALLHPMRVPGVRRIVPSPILRRHALCLASIERGAMGRAPGSMTSM